MRVCLGWGVPLPLRPVQRCFEKSRDRLCKILAAWQASPLSLSVCMSVCLCFPVECISKLI